MDMDISGVYLTYGEGDSRPRSSRVKSARQGRLKTQSVGEAFSGLNSINSFNSFCLPCTFKKGLCQPGFRIRIDFNGDPDPAFFLIAKSLITVNYLCPWKVNEVNNIFRHLQYTAEREGFNEIPIPAILVYPNPVLSLISLLL